MKRCLIAILCFLFNLTSIAQDLDLTTAQEREYNRKKLTVEAIDVTSLTSHASGSATAMPIGDNVIAFGSTTKKSYLTSWKKWRSYQGLLPISEERLFRIAGYDKEADVIKKYRNAGKTLTVFGVLITGAGLVMMAVGLQEVDKYDEYFDMELPEYRDEGLAVGGLISFCFGLVMTGMGASKLNIGKCSTYGIAQGLADEYNAKLLLQIKADF